MSELCAPSPAPSARLLIRPAVLLIRAYQLVFSPLFTGSCRFLPSCSSYALDALERHGVFYGAWLTVRRLARCHPLCAGGHDPIP